MLGTNALELHSALEVGEQLFYNNALQIRLVG